MRRVPKGQQRKGGQEGDDEYRLASKEVTASRARCLGFRVHVSTPLQSI